MDEHEDWYDAIVISNDILGISFPIYSSCVFRRIVINSEKKFEIFNIHSKRVLTREECLKELRSVRNSKNEVVRSKDQGYINWKYSLVG